MMNRFVSPQLTRRAMLSGAAALAAAGCQTKPAGQTLRFWAMSYEGDYSPHLMPPFTRRTGIDVEVQTLPWTAAHEKLLTAYAGGALPDVMMLPSGWISEFAMIGAVAAVPDPQLLRGVFPGLVEASRYAGRDYSVPWSAAPQAQFFRRDLLAAAGYERPPTVWADWREMGRKLKRRRPDEWVLLMPLDWWDCLFTFAGQIEGSLLRDQETRGNFSSPGFREALAFYKSLYDDKLAPPMLSTELQDPFAAFAQGFYAIYPRAPQMLLDLRRRSAEIPERLWGVARMPGPAGPGPTGGVNATLCVASSAQDPAAAWALVRYMADAPAELHFQRLIGSLPARLSAWQAPQMQAAVLQPFRAQMFAPARTPNIVEWERIRIEVQLFAERLVRGQLTIDEATASMDRRVDAILAKRRQLVAAGRIA